MTDRTCETCRHYGKFTIADHTPIKYCALVPRSAGASAYVVLAVRSESGACGPEGRLWEAKKRRFWGFG